jgi:outer membrane protein OmpA-like peptidoglycan-associated protein
MKSRFAGIAGTLALLVLEVRGVPTADACGTKLTVKTSAPRHAVARSSNPTKVLLVGSPPRRLARDLSAAGHRVDSAPSADAGKDDNYSVVIVDNNDQAAAARAKYANAQVIVRSDDVGSDLKTVEARVGRPVLVAARDRKPIAVGPDRTATAAGGTTPEKREVVAAATPAETAPAPTPPAPAPTPARTAPAPTPTPTPAPPKPERVAAETSRSTETPAPKRTAATASNLRQEIYFSLGSARVPGTSRQVAKAIKWLEANPDARVAVEGYADPSGTPEGNMALSQVRADAVKEQLVQGGVDASRIDVNAFGDTKLKYGRSDGRNRRVAIEATK